jgi:DNA-binding transcriptional ArsR family regulator/uncharacterized protein YndB with AHSA1/START domain
VIENDFFRALADPTRRAIFEKLAAGSMNASALRKGMEISQPAMSQHFAVLRSAKLVREERQGRFVNYEVDPEGLALIAQWLAKYRAYWPAHRSSQGLAEGHGSMNEEKTKEQDGGVELEFDLGDPPQKVWRAISIPEFRERWLPKEALADPDAITVTPGQEVRYRLRDDSPPFLESTVTFTITPNATGGTCLRIVHELTDARFDRMARAAANSNSPPLMLAA